MNCISTRGALDPEREDEEVVTIDDECWAWVWPNRTSWPRFDGAWFMTPSAGKYWCAVHARRAAECTAAGGDPHLDIKYDEGDFASFWRWQDGKFRVLYHSLWGGEVWEDASGCVWHMRVREAVVTFPDGHRQVVPLGAGTFARYRLAVESPQAVWVASLESLTRFRLMRTPAGKPDKWVQDRTFALPRMGLHFQGPWIAKEHFYYISGSELYYATLQDLPGRGGGQ